MKQGAARRGGIVRTLGSIGLLVGVVAAACTDQPLDMRPTLGAGTAGRAGGTQAGGGSQSNGLGTGNGGEGGDGGAVSEAGTHSQGGSGGTTLGGSGHGGSAGSAGSVVTGGSGGSVNNALCGNNLPDAGEECDDGNKLSGDGCSYDCKSKCEVCERDVCPVQATVFPTIYADAYAMPGDAQQGPSVGTPRVQLLRKFLDCAYRTNCASVIHVGPSAAISELGLKNCACLNTGQSDDPSIVPTDCYDDSKIMKGPCYAEMKAAAEADTTNEMITRMDNPNYAEGLAFRLLKFCDARFCAEQCVPDEAAAAYCSSVCTSGGTGGTGSGGTGGTDTGGGGSGGMGTPVCGNGVLEQGEECEPASSSECSNHCLYVMNGDCIKQEQKKGCGSNAAACTASPGTTTPESQAACFDVEHCIYSTGCIFKQNAPVKRCFCGSLSLDACAAAPETGDGAPDGACATVIKAGMGAGATNADVMARFLDNNYPAGAALMRLECLANNPAGDCGYLPPCPVPNPLNIPCE